MVGVFVCNVEVMVEVEVDPGAKLAMAAFSALAAAPTLIPSRTIGSMESKFRKNS